MKQLNLIYLNLTFHDIRPEGRELIVKALHKNKTEISKNDWKKELKLRWNVFCCNATK